MKKISPYSFMETLKVNINNKNLSNEAFREFVRNSVTVVKTMTEKEKKEIGRKSLKDFTSKYRQCTSGDMQTFAMGFNEALKQTT